MRIPLSWIRDYTQFPAGGTPEGLMAELVRVGLEEEDVHRPADEISGPIVVGEVLEKTPEPQSNGKTINWCQVRVVPEGQSQTLTGEGIDPSGVQGVVCGADNFEVGDRVVVTMPGAVLPGDFRISARSTYGHVSAGMIASVKELGIGEDHDGILVLSTIGLGDAEIGSDALELLGLHDSAAEINVTPDRGYAFSIRGVAREYSHATGTAFTDPAATVDAITAGPQAHPVTIAEEDGSRGNPGCTTFVARRVTGIDPSRPTPAWMASRLRLAGMRPISLAVDISNYVMLELGQPLHFYDADRLTGGITVRRAQTGEKLTTLDDKQRALDDEDLVIADDSGAIGIAGVMGGAATEVSASTDTVLIEAAHFDEVSVARSKRRHKLPSEASKRFERGVDTQLQAVAAQRAVDLLVDLAGGTDTGEFTRAGEPPQPRVISLDAQLPSRITGVNYTATQVTQTLRAIGAEVTEEAQEAPGNAGMLTVTSPSWRPDLTHPEDLVEEIARLVGYDQIPSRLPVAPAGRGLTRAQQQRRKTYSGLAAAGFTEVLSYPFLSAEANLLFGASQFESFDEFNGLDDQGLEQLGQKLVSLANPIARQYGTMRTTVLPGLLDVVRRNASRGFRDLALFEVGHVFLKNDAQHGSQTLPPLGSFPGESVLDELESGIPDQPLHVAVALAGVEAAETFGAEGRNRDWADAVDAARKIAQLLDVDLEIQQGKHQAFHPGRTAELRFAGQRVGVAGELHPKVVESWDLPERTAVVELNLEALVAGAPSQVDAQSISTFPLTTQDVALIVDEAVTAAELKATLAEGAGQLLEDLELFDVYAGEGIESGKKSLAYALRFRAEDRTLTAEEASEARGHAVALAAERHGAAQR